MILRLPFCIIKKSLTPLPPLLQRGGVLETVRLSNTVCLSNQVMMSVSIRELQGVSRISLPSLWGRGKGEGLLLLSTTAPSAFLTTSLTSLHSPLSYNAGR